MSTQHPTNSAFYSAFPIGLDYGILVCRVFENDRMVENLELQLPILTLSQIAVGAITEVPITAAATMPQNNFRFNYLIPMQTAKIKIDRVHMNWGNATQDLTDDSRSHQNPQKRRFGFMLCDCSFA